MQRGTLEVISLGGIVIIVADSADLRSSCSSPRSCLALASNFLELSLEGVTHHNHRAIHSLLARNTITLPNSNDNTHFEESQDTHA